MEPELEHPNRRQGAWYLLSRPIAATGEKNVVSTGLSGGAFLHLESIGCLGSGVALVAAIDRSNFGLWFGSLQPGFPSL